MALDSTQSLIEISIRNLSGVKGQFTHKAVNLTAICQPIVYKMWEPQRLNNSTVSMACYRKSFIFTFVCNAGAQPPSVTEAGDICISLVITTHIRGVYEKNTYSIVC
jgi:hypothetical protein